MSKKKKQKGVLLAGLGLALTAAGAVGGRFLYGTKAGVKQRKKLEGWAKDLKEDAIALAAGAQVLSRKTYHDAVVLASKKYKRLKAIDANDVDRVVKEIQGHWKEVEVRLSKVEKAVKKAAKKNARKSSRRK